MLIRFKFAFVTTLAITFWVSIAAYFKTSQSEVAWITGIFCFVFMLPLVYFRMSRNILTGRFKYNFKHNNNVLYSSAVNYYDKIFFYGRSLSSQELTTSMGGNLYLLEDRLVFQTNGLNYSSRREVEISIADVFCVSIDFDCPFGRSFAIETGTHKYRFLSKYRDEWKTQILRRKAAL